MNHPDLPGSDDADETFVHDDTLPEIDEARARGLATRLASILLRGVLLAGVVFALMALAGRYWWLPQVDRHRAWLEQQATQALGVPVRIARLEGEWSGVHPRLTARGVQLFDAQGREALTLERVDGEPGFRSLFLGRLLLHRLEIRAPVLAVRRDADGHLFVAGIRVNPDQPGGGVGDWLLAQRRIVVRDAQLTWSDEARGAPPLPLAQVQLRIDNDGDRHRFALLAEPPATLASRLDVRGDLYGETLDRPDAWRGLVYAAIERTDLAGWRQWVDYPVELDRGHGGLRLWLDLAGRSVREMTADLSLEGVGARLRDDLPVLDLKQLGGRLTLRRETDTLAFGARQLRFEAGDGLVLPPSDLSLRWQPRGETRPERVEATADGLDLGVLARTAAYLPLPPEWLQALTELAPQGRLLDTTLSWERGAGRPLKFSVESRFERLGLNPRGHWPGVAGLSGRIEGNQDKGSVALDSRDLVLDMPAVFPEPRLSFQRLQMEAGWRAPGAPGMVDLNFKSVSFANRDAVGSASGRYRAIPGQRGEIDLQASITQADGTAVWRYLPLTVSQRARDWVREGIDAGTATDATLKLRGRLDDFPFVGNRNGQFLVKAKVHGATVDYASGWPAMHDVDGTLLFEGERMRVEGERGRIMDVQLSGVSAEIPDLLHHQERLLIKGRAAGATQDFLDFIEQSPVAAWIEHFTQGYQARGNGALELGIDMPLRDYDNTQVNGRFRFQNNVVRPGPEWPELAEASGRVEFTRRSFALTDGAAKLFGAPLTLSAASRDGVVALDLRGQMPMAQLRQQFDSPLTDELSGTANWRGRLNMRGAGLGSLVFESDLVGVASSLPEPFNKTGREVLKLSIERGEAAPGAGDGRDLIRISLGERVKAQLVRRRVGNAMQLERGVVAIGETPAALPARGLLVSGSLAELDVDRWRKLLASPKDAAAADGPALPPLALRLKAERARLLGQTLEPFSVRAEQEDEVLSAVVASSGLDGRVVWQPRGQGLVVARLKRLELGEASGSAMVRAHDELADEELPAIDLIADDFQHKGKALGRLELRAANRGGTWLVDKLAVDNPDMKLAADGRWRPAGGTRLKFKLDSDNVGKLLTRLGYPDAVRGATAALAGEVGWAGPPTAIDWQSLDGRMELQTTKGQFNKLDPGVGRLLGILSLQSLPRRITLDFRDIFSEGLAFDRIGGVFTVAGGTMHTDELEIDGPAARIRMRGDVDLVAETQALRVEVQPQLGESLSVGAMLVNPAVGAATLLAQKVLRNPLDKLFSYEYAVSGPWTEPQVVKVSEAAQEAAPPASPAPRRGGTDPERR